MANHTTGSRRRISFDRWKIAFQDELKKKEVAAVIQRWERGGIHVDRLLMWLWIYCCAPSKKRLQEALFASDHQITTLHRRILDTANQIEQLNKGVAANMFLGVVQKAGPLLSYKLPWGANLEEIPRLFKISPEVLRLYAHTLKAGRDHVKNAIADRPLLRGRILQTLYFSVRDRDARVSPFEDLATVMGVAFLAAGDSETVIGEANLQRQFVRFKDARPKESKSAELMAVLGKDHLPIQWFELVLPFLLTKGPLRTLVPV